MPCDVIKPCHVSTLNSCNERFVTAHQTFDLARCVIIGVVFPETDAEELLQAFVLEHLETFSCLSQWGSNLTPVEEDRYGHRFLWLELGLEADVSFPYRFPSSHRCCSDIVDYNR